MAKKREARVSMHLIVRRGAKRKFQELADKTTHLPVRVTWDRRKGDRRVAAGNGHVERRTSDRRGAPPSMWDLSDFLVVTKTRKSKVKAPKKD
jgi:hypothetical protein